MNIYDVALGFFGGVLSTVALGLILLKYMIKRSVKKIMGSLLVGPDEDDE